MTYIVGLILHAAWGAGLLLWAQYHPPSGWQPGEWGAACAGLLSATGMTVVLAGIQKARALESRVESAVASIPDKVTAAVAPAVASAVGPLGPEVFRLSTQVSNLNARLESEGVAIEKRVRAGEVAHQAFQAIVTALRERGWTIDANIGTGITRMLPPRGDKEP